MSSSVTIEIAGIAHDVPADLARAAGWVIFACGSVRQDRHGAEVWVMRAMSEGLRDAPAFLRALALAAENARAAEDAAMRVRVADAELHAARVRRQAAMLECRAKGISPEIGERC